ncbi:RHS repeat domain-containing protein [Paenibacillus sp. YAF4_2]
MGNSYDERDQLSKETLYDGTEISYEYDIAGNRTKKSIKTGTLTNTTSYNYNSENQLITVESIIQL